MAATRIACRHGCDGLPALPQGSRKGRADVEFAARESLGHQLPETELSAEVLRQSGSVGARFRSGDQPMRGASATRGGSTVELGGGDDLRYDRQHILFLRTVIDEARPQCELAVNRRI